MSDDAWTRVCQQFLVLEQMRSPDGRLLVDVDPKHRDLVEELRERILETCAEIHDGAVARLAAKPNPTRAEARFLELARALHEVCALARSGHRNLEVRTWATAAVAEMRALDEEIARGERSKS